MKQLVICAFVSAVALWAQDRADVIYLNGKVVTLWDARPAAQAVAIRGNRLLAVEKENLFEMVRVANQLGWQVTAHATGGGAMDLLLEAYESADRSRPVRGGRHNLMHANFPNPDSIQRARKLGAVFDSQMAWQYCDGDTLKDVFGPSRIKDLLPLRSLIDAGLVVAAMGAAPPRKPAGRPNVLFFFADQVRAAELGYNGGRNIATPHIDRLASQGVTFSNAISTYPLCTPYRAMLQTGRYPALSGGVMNWVNVPGTGQCVADAFARGGYDTGFIGKWHLAAGARAGTLKRDAPPKQLAESEYVPPGPARMGYRYWAAFNFHASFRQAFYYRDTPQRLVWPAYETDAETDEAMSFMRSRGNSGQPFFLMVAPHPPHPPWRPDFAPPGYLDKVPKDLYWRPNVKGRRDQPQNDPRCYFAMLSNVDDNVGRLMRFLDESGLADNTIVVFTSDHGEMMASQGRYNKMVPYAEAMDIPLIMRWPGRIKAGGKTDVLHTPMDYFPTLAAMCGLEIPKMVSGVDLSGQVLEGKGRQRDAALIMNFVSHWDFPETMTEWPEWRGVRTKQHTYARWLNGAEELYDNVADPYQARNLFDGRNAPAALTHLRARLKDLLKEAHDEFLPGNRYGEWFDLDRNLVREPA